MKNSGFGRRNGTAISASETAVSASETVVSASETAISVVETVVSDAETVVWGAEAVILDAETAVSDTETAVSEPKRSFRRQNDRFGRRMGTKTKGYENECQRRAKVAALSRVVGKSTADALCNKCGIDQDQIVVTNGGKSAGKGKGGARREQ